MKDVSRIAIGLSLLGLAIFISLNFDEGKMAESTTTESAEIADLRPEWQSRSPASTLFANHSEEEDFVRPEFDNSNRSMARPLAGASDPLPGVASQLTLPPTIAEQYLPMQRMSVSGQLQRESEMVPVKPRPSFTGAISYVKQIHTVREGDSLQSIAREYFGSSERYLDIYLLNKDVLSNPGKPPVGVEIRIPAE